MRGEHLHSGSSYKRLSRGRFPWWPQKASAATEALEAHELTVLLSAGNPAGAKGAPLWRRVSVGL